MAVEDPKVAVKDPKVAVEDPKVAVEDPKVAVEDPRWLWRTQGGYGGLQCSQKAAETC